MFSVNKLESFPRFGSTLPMVAEAVPKLPACPFLPTPTIRQSSISLYFISSIPHYFLFEPHAPSRRLANVRGSRGFYRTHRRRQGMQELILIEPGNTAPKSVDAEWTREAEHAAIRREFEECLADSSALAFRVARGVLKNDADAEDVAQESLIRAFRKFARLRDRNRFRAWLVRISFRIALDRLRSAKRRGLREAEWMREQERSRPANSQGSREFRLQLERAMEELPEKLRLALLLSAVEGHSLEEVAVLLSVPVGTVKSRIFFARKQLAEKLRCFVTLTADH